MKKNKTITITALILGLFLGGGYGFISSRDSIGQASLASEIDALKAEIERTAQNEFTHGCVEEDEKGHIVFCGASKIKMDALNNEITALIRSKTIRSADQVAMVEKNAQTITGNSSLRLTFDALVNNPYTNSEYKVEYYKDADGTMYMVDPASNEVISFTSNGIFSSDKKLSDEELRNIAQSYLAKNINDFDQLRKSYAYEEGSKGIMRVFRYNAPAKVNGENMLPFVQVKLSEAGELIGFSDIRNLYK